MISRRCFALSIAGAAFAASSAGARADIAPINPNRRRPPPPPPQPPGEPPKPKDRQTAPDPQSPVPAAALMRGDRRAPT